MKDQKGITLIALVITIIVLLILAGITIAMLTGENGILSNGTKAKAQNELGAAKDAVALAATEAVSDYYETVYVNSSSSTPSTTLISEVITKIGAATSGNTTKTIPATVNVTKAPTTSDAVIVMDCNGWYVKGTISSTGVITWDAYTQTNPAV